LKLPKTGLRSNSSLYATSRIGKGIIGSRLYNSNREKGLSSHKELNKPMRRLAKPLKSVKKVNVDLQLEAEDEIKEEDDKDEILLFNNRSSCSSFTEFNVLDSIAESLKKHSIADKPAVKAISKQKKINLEHRKFIIFS
jgi:hypothetical protein